MKTYNPKTIAMTGAAPQATRRVCKQSANNAQTEGKTTHSEQQSTPRDQRDHPGECDAEERS